MNWADRVARLLIVPLLLLFGFLLLRDGGGEEDTTEAGGEASSQTPDAGGETTAPPETLAPDTTQPGGETTAPPATSPAVDASQSGGETTTTVPPPTEASGSLAPADPASPPLEPRGVYKDGKVVLSGSVPTAELAAGFQRRAASVLGEENVTSEMTFDERVQGQTLSIDVDQKFRFPPGEITFDPEFEALLNLGAAALQLLPEAQLSVTGHTDAVGDDATNLALGQARAQVVVDWMVARGIAPDRVVARSAGESEPIADNATPEGREANRRIEAVLEGVTPG